MMPLGATSVNGIPRACASISVTQARLPELRGAPGHGGGCRSAAVHALKVDVQPRLLKETELDGVENRRARIVRYRGDVDRRQFLRSHRLRARERERQHDREQTPFEHGSLS
jgi:hypothetical protein